MGLRFNKKGDVVFDVLLGIITFMVIVFGVFLFYQPFKEVNEDLQQESDLSAQTKQTVNDATVRFPKIFEGVFVFIFIFMLVITLITSYYLDANPVFFIISVILLIICVVIGAVMSNTYQETMNDEELVELKSDFPITNWIMTKLVMICIVEFILVGVVVYAKTQG